MTVNHGFLHNLIMILQIFTLFSTLFTDSPTAGASTTSIPVVDVRGDNSENPEYDYDYRWVLNHSILLEKAFILIFAQPRRWAAQ